MLRSVNLEQDIGNREILRTLLPLPSQMNLLHKINCAVNEHEYAFTITGTYGSGKSTLALILSSLFKITPHQTDEILNNFYHQDPKFLNKINNLLPSFNNGVVISLIGSKLNLREALCQKLKLLGSENLESTSQEIFKTLSGLAKQNKVLIIIDEMGAFIESAVKEHDLIFIQELAEFVSRKQGHILLIALIHQSFESYLNSELKVSDEWNKIQGRFLNLIFDPNLNDSLQLIANKCKLININQVSTSEENLNHCQKLVTYFNKEIQLKLSLPLFSACLPLHSLTTLLLIAISKKPYGQNERTINSILYSQQPYALHDFLENISPQQSNLPLYAPWHFFDFIINNQDLLINDQTDLHLLKVAEHLLDRLKIKDLESLSLKIFKTIALIELLGNLFKIKATSQLLKLTVNQDLTFNEALQNLLNHKVILYKEIEQAYFLYNSSDFDFKKAFKQAYENTHFDLNLINHSIQQNNRIFARRHYCQTGTLRYITIKLLNFSDLKAELLQFHCKNDEIGLIILVFCQNLKEIAQLKQLSIQISCNIMLGIINDPQIFTKNRELQALQNLQNNPEIAGDPIARREVKERLEYCERDLQNIFKHLLTHAKFLKQGLTQQFSYSQLTKQASDLAEKLFNCTFFINNELINRNKLPASITTARTKLMQYMIHNQHQENLGITGSPAEYTLYQSILKSTHLHHQNLITQEEQLNYRSSLVTDETKTFFQLTELKIQKLQINSLNALYQMWTEPPFGIKDAIKPILFLIFLMSNLDRIAFYSNNLFITELNDDLIDEILSSADKITFKCYDNEVNQSLTLQIQANLEQFFNEKIDQDPLSLARKLFSFIKNLPHLTRHTKELTESTLNLRNLIQIANDPIELLYQALPKVLPNLNQDLKTALNELADFKPHKLHEIQTALFKAFNTTDLKALNQKINTLNPEMLSDLQLKNFCELFKNYASQSDDLTERLIVLCSQKVEHTWDDKTLKTTLQEIPLLATKFRKAQRAQIFQNDLKLNDQHTHEIFNQINNALNSLDYQQKLAIIAKLEQEFD